jgi:hypothetical protein
VATQRSDADSGGGGGGGGGGGDSVVKGVEHGMTGRCHDRAGGRLARSWRGDAWGCMRLVPRDHPHRRLAWLLQGASVALPPASQLLKACLLQGLHTQVCCCTCCL